MSKVFAYPVDKNLRALSLTYPSQVLALGVTGGLSVNLDHWRIV
jgi:hypothetical protein